MMIEALNEIERLRQNEAHAARKESVMTQDQVTGITRQVLQAAGMMATMLGFTAIAGEVQGWTPTILASIGPIMQLAALAWNVKANTKASIVQSASAMPEVKSMTITDPALAEAAKKPDAPARVLLKDEDGSK